MLLFEKNEIIVKAFYHDSSLTIEPHQSSPERQAYAQRVASSEQSIAQIYLKTSLREVTTEDVKNHFLLRGWKFVKRLFEPTQ